MKKLLMVCMVLAGFTRCNMLYTEGFNTYFWTSTEGKELYLFIEGKNKGVLPYLPVAPDCDSEASKKKALMIYLPSGAHDIVVKNAQMETVYSEELIAKRRKGSLTIGTSTVDERGGSKRSFEDACLIEELYLEK